VRPAAPPEAQKIERDAARDRLDQHVEVAAHAHTAGVGPRAPVSSRIWAIE